MQLTAIHLDYIDRFLEQRKVDFLDFKIELKKLSDLYWK